MYQPALGGREGGGGKWLTCRGVGGLLSAGIHSRTHFPYSLHRCPRLCHRHLNAQNISRWAVWTAAGLLRRYKTEFEALQVAIGAGKPVDECVKVIEGTATA